MRMVAVNRVSATSVLGAKVRNGVHVVLVAAFVALFLAACAGGPSYVRDTEMKEIDEYAMSTGLDRRDLDRLFDDNAKSLLSSGIMSTWKERSHVGKLAAVAIFPIKNETTEHIDRQLDALLSKFETRLVNAGFLNVISHERQRTLVEELRLQQSAAFDPIQAARLGKQLGAHYFVTGKIYDNAERTGSERRVQYFLFMQVIDVETGAIRWQNEAKLTKALVN